MSRIGILPIDLPSGVTVTISETNEVKVKGPKGEISQLVDPDIKVEVKENQAIMMLFGTLATGFGMVLQYFFGSSAGSAAKTQLMASQGAAQNIKPPM